MEHQLSWSLLAHSILLAKIKVGHIAVLILGLSQRAHVIEVWRRKIMNFIDDLLPCARHFAKSKLQVPFSSRNVPSTEGDTHKQMGKLTIFCY